MGAIDYQKDGSRAAYDINAVGEVHHKAVFNSEGHKIFDAAVNDPTQKIEQDWSMTSLPKLDVQPLKEWQDKEKLHFPHTIAE